MPMPEGNPDLTRLPSGGSEIFSDIVEEYIGAHVVKEIESRNDPVQDDAIKKIPYDDQKAHVTFESTNYETHQSSTDQSRDNEVWLNKNVQTSEYDYSYVDESLKENTWFNTLVDSNEDPKDDEGNQINPESNSDPSTRSFTDFTKPLPLVGPEGNRNIPIRNFFNRDLKYMMHGNKERMHALSL
ncbi:hypothetical protein Tco_1462765 [Tanacetum coccineum]